MQYYRSTITNLIVSANFVKSLDYVYGKGTVENLIGDGTLEEVVEPSVIDCIRHGSGSVAVLRYREIHPETSWDEASSEIRKMKRDIFRRNKNRKENE